MRILVIEDERRLAGNIARTLRETAGYAVDCAYDGEEGLYMATENPYDLIVLDLMLPILDGAGVLQGIRKQGNVTPVMVLTARDARDSIIKLLDAGADDYVSKPFDLGELIARAKALIRRGKGHASSKLVVRDLVIDAGRQCVFRSGEAIALSAMEYRVLEYLAHRQGAVVSKTELLEHLYDFNWERFSNVIEVYISGLRRKLRDKDGGLIQTLRGRGYLLRE